MLDRGEIEPRFVLCLRLLEAGATGALEPQRPAMATHESIITYSVAYGL
jgi:hypothetical protein